VARIERIELMEKLKHPKYLERGLSPTKRGKTKSLLCVLCFLCVEIFFL
jgi:hypothetical protein